MRLKRLDSRLRGNDTKQRFPTFYETVNFELPTERKPEFDFCSKEVEHERAMGNTAEVS